jgi:hypothetical protein
MLICRYELQIVAAAKYLNSLAMPVTFTVAWLCDYPCHTLNPFMMRLRSIITSIFCVATILLLLPDVLAQKNKELVFQDKNGVVRWTDSNKEVSLFGANYCLPSACDYRAAGYISNDRKKMIDQDLSHFVRMGWEGLRVCLWGDFQNSDKDGNLVNNDHLDLMDYLIAKAKERGIYMLFSPIVTYSSQWPDAMADTIGANGFSTHFKKSELGTNPAAIKAQTNYLRQLMNHVNPYTKTALKDEKAILFVEMINEPTHHSKDVKGSVAYINALVDAVRSTGCSKILYHNVSQDFEIATAMQQSKIQGASFAWYPSGLNSGKTLTGNYLRSVDRYDLMLKPELAKMSKIVYEFDQPDLSTSYMYPAMARTFRSVGAQFAAIFSYDMLATAAHNLGWQTHYMNMVFTPNKAVSGIIASEIMRTLPRGKSYGNYPQNTVFPPFRISYEEDLSEMITAEKFIYANSTKSKPDNVDQLKQIIGCGSSSIVDYEGKGIYFLDKVSEGVWRLEVHPDAVFRKDPFQMPSPDKIVSRAMARNWNMSLKIQDLGNSFTLKSINGSAKEDQTAQNGEIKIRPGVYILSKEKGIDLTKLPKTIVNLAMNEFVSPDAHQLPVDIKINSSDRFVAGRPMTIQADVYSNEAPDAVSLYVRPKSSRRFFKIPMKHIRGFAYEAALPASVSKPGWFDYSIVVEEGKLVTNLPAGTHIKPDDWDYYDVQTFSGQITDANASISLVDPLADVSSISFTRVGDNIRHGIFNLVPGSEFQKAAFKLELPVDHDKDLEDYTISIPVKNKLKGLSPSLEKVKQLQVKYRGAAGAQDMYLTLMQKDGTSWVKKLDLTQNWTTQVVDLNSFSSGKGVMLPLGYPGRWNYWVQDSGKAKEMNLAEVEWVQLSVRPSENAKSKQTSWIELENVSAIHAAVN